MHYTIRMHVFVKMERLERKKRELANKKRSEFYKTVKGIEIKKLYKEKSQKKKKLIESLMELKREQ